jgi:integrase
MTQALTTSRPSSRAVSPRTKRYIHDSKSPRTLKIYRAALANFEEACRLDRVRALPADPETVADYISELADQRMKVSTLRVHLAAIASAHRIANLPDPTVSEIVHATMKGIAHDHGTRPHKKAPLTLDVLSAMIAATPGSDLISVRDRAILILDFGGMFRRSEIVALDVADLEFESDRLKVLVRRAKTDQAGKGLTKHLPLLVNAQLCPVRAVRAWLTAGGIKHGPLFRPIGRWNKKVADERFTDKGIVRAIKDAAERAGLDPSLYAGHSARRGGITSALRADAAERDLMAQTGHHDMDTMLEYRDDAGIGALNAARAAFGE